jgi:hypothetical protein
VSSLPFSIARRFRGPPRSGNGGYVAGSLGRHLVGTVAVRIKAPPPLETGLSIELGDEHARLLHQSTVIAEARAAQITLQPPPAPSFASAEEAARSFGGFERHPLPECFVCGPRREAGDALRIFPGERGELLLAPWIPHASLADASGKVAPEFLWAALDCPGGFAVIKPAGKLIVLGELCARIDGSVSPGEHCVVAGWEIGREGRKRYAGTAVYSADGEPVAVARATWIELGDDAAGKIS